ncbi:L-serine dehydratase, putative [Talaromyces stipitatus ATCC 10500]|uniref:L-serine ammonia-lyase n=1 Tax=Talaromyces stipitatus (strain ATCC 10500 / CBS 375.48 / QM 6759 / NRRL 1006) TaxID=441959 RepID=B8MK73_TALSN|nr:L-serine dehydratase, putative [Talaromyces stipitatus ATCC 10500]EED15228.1 L-serine dehydratase, putative [Talaromyces stipitatus ATCC 10500]
MTETMTSHNLNLSLTPLSPETTRIKTTSRTEYKAGKPWIETPLIESAILSKKAGCRIFLKLENLQPSGSFKSRAIGSLILYHINDPLNANKKLHFFINSGGNAGLAAVCAARSLSYPCTVVLPLSTSRLMVEKLCAAGATEVIQYGDTIAAAGEYMRDVLIGNNQESEKEEEEEGVKKIALHPFDHEAIWEGNSSIVDELADQLPPADEELPLDALICSVGGGGLMNGLIQGIQRHRRHQHNKKDVHILAVETDGTQSMNLAISSGTLATLPKVTSMAVSLACVRVSQRTFEYCCVSPPEGIRIHSAVLSDADAARGCLRLADEERILVELACGVCVEAAVGDVQETGRKRGREGEDEGYEDQPEAKRRASLCASDSGVASSSSSDTESDILLSEQLTTSYLKRMIPDLTPQSRVVIIVCGGSNVTTAMANEWRERLANGWV